MAARRGARSQQFTDTTSNVYRGMGHAYSLWAVAVMISALGLKPTSISAAGVSLSIEHPEVIQGVLYLAAFWTSTAHLLLFHRDANVFASPEALRRYIWNGLPRGTRSFRGRTRGELKSNKEKAKAVAYLVSWMHALPLVALPILLLTLKGRVMGSALGAFFASSL